jgi:hypothetical protein
MQRRWTRSACRVYREANGEKDDQQAEMNKKLTLGYL